MTAGIYSVADAMRYQLVSLTQSSCFFLVLDEAMDISVREQVAISVRV